MRKHIVILISIMCVLLASGSVSSDSSNCDWFCWYGNLERNSSKPDCMFKSSRLMKSWVIKHDPSSCQKDNPINCFNVVESSNSNGKIYNSCEKTVTIEGQPKKAFYLNCIDSQTGEHVFTKQLFLANEPSWEWFSPPFIDGELIYIIVGKIILKLNNKGEILKTIAMPSKTTYDSPLIYKNYLLIATEKGEIYCYDKNEGNLLWKHAVSSYLETKMSISDDKIFITATAESNIVCLDLLGKTIWQKEISSNYLGNPIIAGNYLVVPSNYDRLFCYNKNTGDKIWETQCNVTSENGISANLDFISIQDYSKIVLISAKTGEIKWEKEFVKNDTSRINSFLPKQLYSGMDLSILIGNDIFFIERNCIYLVNTKSAKPIRVIPFEINYLRFYLGNMFIYYQNENGDIVCMVDASDTVKFKLGEKEYKTDTRNFTMDVPLQVINGTTYIPAKYVVEPLGGQITWVDKTKTINSKLLVPGSDELMKNNPDNYVAKFNNLEMKVNSNLASLNYLQMQIDPKNPKITPIIINGRTMVPMRFLAESLGCKVEWKADTKEIIVTYQP